MHALTITRSVYGSGSLTATLLPNDLFKEIHTYLKSHLSLIHCLMLFVMLDLHGSYHFHASWVFFKTHTTHTHNTWHIVAGFCLWFVSYTSVWWRRAKSSTKPEVWDTGYIPQGANVYKPRWYRYDTLKERRKKWQVEGGRTEQGEFKKSRRREEGWGKRGQKKNSPEPPCRVWTTSCPLSHAKREREWEIRSAVPPKKQNKKDQTLVRTCIHWLKSRGRTRTENLDSEVEC